ncbi:hypothetical protein D3C86_1402860 [compost metagenome]
MLGGLEIHDLADVEHGVFEVDGHAARRDQRRGRDHARADRRHAGALHRTGHGLGFVVLLARGFQPSLRLRGAVQLVRLQGDLEVGVRDLGLQPGFMRGQVLGRKPGCIQLGADLIELKLVLALGCLELKHVFFRPG